MSNETIISKFTRLIITDLKLKAKSKVRKIKIRISMKIEMNNKALKISLKFRCILPSDSTLLLKVYLKLFKDSLFKSLDIYQTCIGYLHII